MRKIFAIFAFCSLNLCLPVPSTNVQMPDLCGSFYLVEGDFDVATSTDNDGDLTDATSIDEITSPYEPKSNELGMTREQDISCPADVQDSRVPIKDDSEDLDIDEDYVKVDKIEDEEKSALSEFQIIDDHFPMLDPTLDYLSQLSEGELVTLDEKLQREWIELAEGADDITTLSEEISKEKVKHLRQIAKERWVIRNIIGCVFTTGKFLAKVQLASQLSGQNDVATPWLIASEVDKVLSTSSKAFASKISEYEGIEIPESGIRDWCTEKVIHASSLAANTFWDFITWRKSRDAESLE